MVVELIYRETLDVLRSNKARTYLKSALDVVNFMVNNNLDDINSCSRYFMSLCFDKYIHYPELYGNVNYCRGLSGCKGRLPSIGNVICYLSKYGQNIEVTLIDKENNIYFSLDLYTSATAPIMCGTTFDTEKLE